MDIDKIDTVEDVPGITRVEVIDETGRAYVNTQVNGTVQYSLQDGGRTLKIFLRSKQNEHSA
jgi:hypothetical protein